MSKFKIGSEYKSKNGRRHIRIINCGGGVIYYKDLVLGGSSYFLEGSGTYEEMEFFK